MTRSSCPLDDTEVLPLTEQKAAAPEPRTWDYEVTKLIRAVDGDTYDLRLEREMDFGFRLTETKAWESRFRILHINAPEKRSAGGSASTQYATIWINAALAEGVLRGQTHKTDDFGRWLIDLYRTDTGEHLADAMVAANQAVPYMTTPNNSPKETPDDDPRWVPDVRIRPGTENNDD